MFCFYSNRIEVLYEQLKERLKLAPPTPFTERIVVVPSPAVKEWLQLKLAGDLGVVLGIKFFLLDEALFHIKRAGAKRLPSFHELRIRIESELHYLPPSELNIPDDPSKKAKRLHYLAKDIALLFERYGRYHPKLTQKWDSAPTKGWMPALWKKIYSESFTYPYKHFLENFNGSCDLDLFGLAFISEWQFAFLEKLSERSQVNLWLLSPCFHFWTDAASDREASRQLDFWDKKNVAVDQLEEILREKNPLLANFGVMGREMAKRLEERVIETEELYVAPKAIAEHPFYPPFESPLVQTSEKPTALRYVQADMLFLRKPETAIEITDSSIQFHMASSKKREVEIVYNLIIERLKDNPSLTPADINVMAPALEPYIPYIKSIFAGNLKAFIADSGIDDDLSKTFLKMLNLRTGRWTPGELLELISSPSFCKKAEIERDNIPLIREWAEKLRVDWGFDNRHIGEKISGSGFSWKGDSSFTWEGSLQRLLKSFIYGEEPDVELKMTDIALFKAFSSLLTRLNASLHLFKGDSLRPLKEWKAALKKLLEDFFEGGDEVLEAILSLPDEGELPFYSVEKYLTQKLSQIELKGRQKNLSAVRFSSFLPMRTLPGQVIILMGMEEGSYPRHERIGLTDSQPKEDYCPTPYDFDRGLFLEAILAARSHLIITASQPLSGIASELLSYLESTYKNERWVWKHPAASYDPLYFSSPHFHSFSGLDYKGARKIVQSERIPHAFIKSFQSVPPPSPLLPLVQLRDLEALFKNPVKFHLQKMLKLRLREDYRQSSSFEITGLDRYKVKESFLQGKRRALPLDGAFKEVKDTEIEEELSGYHEYLSSENLKDIGSSPLQIEWNKTLLVGEIQLSHEKGLISFKSHSFSDLVPLIPRMVSRAHRDRSGEVSVYSLKEKKKVVIRFDEGYMEQLLNYYTRSRSALIPFMPEWSLAILQKDHAELEKSLERSLTGFGYKDPYLLWAFKKHLLKSEDIIEKYHPLAKTLFQSVWEAIQ